MSALNQIFADLLPTLNDQDIVLVQGDSILDPHFAEVAAKYLTHGYGGVGGVFRGGPGSGFMGHLQRKEYARYARDVSRLDGKCLVREFGPDYMAQASLSRSETVQSYSVVIAPSIMEVSPRGREGSVRRLYSRHQRPICIEPERQH